MPWANWKNLFRLMSILLIALEARSVSAGALFSEWGVDHARFMTNPPPKIKGLHYVDRDGSKSTPAVCDVKKTKDPYCLIRGTFSYRPFEDVVVSYEFTKQSKGGAILSSAQLTNGKDRSGFQLIDLYEEFYEDMCERYGAPIPLPKGDGDTTYLWRDEIRGNAITLGAYLGIHIVSLSYTPLPEPGKNGL